MQIKTYENFRKIFGTNIQSVTARCKEFPKLKVSIITAPAEPRKIIAANYITCIEGVMVYPSQIIDERADELTNWVIAGGHTPALESVQITFAIEGASVVLLKQISRHRIGNSLGVRTQRANATNLLGKIGEEEHYITPPSFTDHPEVIEAYKKFMIDSQNLYNLCINKGIQQDEARYVIPQSGESIWQGTYAYITLMKNICSTRMCHVMQGEMVALSHMMGECVKEYDEMLGAALKPICMHTGACNRNENNPTKDHPKGVCEFTVNGKIPARKADDTLDLTQYSKDATK